MCSSSPSTGRTMPQAPLFRALGEALRARRAVALATVIEGANTGAKLLVEPGTPPRGTVGDPGLDSTVALDAASDLDSGTTTTHRYEEHGVSVFVESFVPPPLMLILGAVSFAAALANVAKVLGYHVVVCDARAAFATPERFPMADAVVAAWPHKYLLSVGDTLGARDAVCVLAHDAKFDVPAIAVALDTQVGYVGVLGSRRTHAERLALLEEAGVDAAAARRLYAPIGLDIGARTPGETAVAICAEIIAARSGRGGGPLRDTTGSIR